MKINKKAFTLVELLVVVLIIGILAAIAVPQYQTAVSKANLHKGIPLVESLYQAQQAYYLTHGEFANDIDTLDISLPLNNSCEKTQSTYQSVYRCDFGTIGISVRNKAIMFTVPNSNISYLHFFIDDKIKSLNVFFEKDKRYCYAKSSNQEANIICQSMGGTYIGENPNIWYYYELP